MTAIDALIQQPATQAIGWALLQFFWQGALIGGLTAAALVALKRSAADIRYVVASIGLLLMLTMPVVTAVQALRADDRSTASIAPPPELATTGDRVERRARPRAAVVPNRGGTITSAAASATASQDRAAAAPWLSLFVVAWLSGVLVLSLRLMSGWLWVQRMKSHRASPAAEDWVRLAARLCRQLHISRPVRLLASSLVEVPTVIGWMRPVVLLPIGALAGMSPQQFEAILAHELAHIRRHDYLVNLLQTLVETLLFYHPAVWWLSGRIRAERENCCDDLAVSLCGDPCSYARALAELESRRGSRGRLALAASGGSLVQRVRRLLGAPSHAGRGPGWLAGTAAGLLLAGIAGGAMGHELIENIRQREAVPARPAARPAQRQPAESPSRPAAAAARESRPVRAREGSAVDVAIAAAEQAPEIGSAVLARAEVPMEAAFAEVARAAESAAAVIAAAGEAVEAHAPAVLAVAEAARTALSTATRAQSDEQGNFTWSDGKQKLEVKYRGAIEFSDDDTDLKSLSPGGYLRIREGGWSGSHAIEFTADGSGAITRRYWEGSSERPFEPEGRAWLARMLPTFIRQTAIGASARVARILKTKGTAGVLAEISLIQGSWGKRRYFTELLKADRIDARTAAQILSQAGREIDSDFELASLLIESGDQLVQDEASRRAYFEAARTIGSDFEMRRVYSAAVKRGPIAPDLLASVLEASTSIESDFEAASLYLDVLKQQALDDRTRAPFFRAVAGIDSDFEHRRVLSAVVRTRMTADDVNAVLQSAGGIHSDFEVAGLLIDLLKAAGIEGMARGPFFKAAATMSSDFERGRVLKAVVDRPDASNETILEVLRSARGMSSSHETSQVLLAVARRHTLTGEARETYIDAAEKLGDFEQGRVLSALVRSEREKK